MPVADVSRVGNGPIVPCGAVSGYGPIFNAGRGVPRRPLPPLRARRAGRVSPEHAAAAHASSTTCRTSSSSRPRTAWTTPSSRSWPRRPRRAPTPTRTRGCTSFAPTAPSISSCPTRTCRRRRRHEFWRIGVHLLTYADGRFSLDQSSARVVGPPGEPDKDGIVFNLADGRVALIHRIYPNMQLAVFDSLEQLVDPPAGYWERHMAELDRHTIIRPGDNVSRRRRRCAAGGHRRRAAAALPRAERRTRSTARGRPCSITRPAR